MGFKAKHVLPFWKREEWRWRWMYTIVDDHDRLHRIVKFDKKMGVTDDSDEWGVKGVMGGEAACGMKGNFEMPGVLARLGCPRCEECCNKLDVPHGEGAPLNQRINA